MVNEQCDQIEKDMTRGNSKNAFSTLKTLTKDNKTKSSVIEDKSGLLTVDRTNYIPEQVDRILQ